MRLGADNFGGVMPRLAPRLLPNNGAEIADNTKMFSGELRSWNQAQQVFLSAKIGAMKSAYRLYSGPTNFWLTWIDDVDAVKGPIAGDTSFRLFYTGDSTDGGRPKKTNLALATSAIDYPHDYLEMGIPAPTQMGITGIVGGVGGNVTVGYVCTYVTTWNEEGPPSPVISATGKIDAGWSVSLPLNVPGKYAIDRKRIYRTVTSASGLVDYFFVTELAVATSGYTDDRTINTDALLAFNETIPSYEYGIVGSEWLAPPDNLKGLKAGPNGVMAGFSGNQICFSAPYQPHAWPIRQQYAVPWDIVAIELVGDTWVIATKGRPFLARGTSPEAMSLTPVPRDDMPCLSKRSMVAFSFGAAFAVPNGLALIGVGDPTIVTQDHMTHDEWEALCFPDTMIAKAYGERYFGFFNTGNQSKGIVFDKALGDRALSFLNQSANGLYTDPETSRLYILNDTQVLEWDADEVNKTNYDWMSKIFVLPKPTNFGFFQVDADYSVLAGAFEADRLQRIADNVTNAAIELQLSEDWALGTAGKYKGELGSHMLGGYVQYDSSDPLHDGPVNSNNHGIVLGGSLLVGGVYANFASRTLLFRAYAYSYETSTMRLVWSEYLDNGRPKRLPGGFKADAWQYRVSGNISTHRFGVANTIEELATLT